jgi:hypothetical protein
MHAQQKTAETMPCAIRGHTHIDKAYGLGAHLQTIWHAVAAHHCRTSDRIAYGMQLGEHFSFMQHMLSLGNY